MKNQEINISGKWKYRENYGYGLAEGELIIEQDGNKVSGKIIFTDHVKGEKAYMIQEFVRGEVDKMNVNLYAYAYDIIDSDREIYYELDNWFGILVDDTTIKGVSKDTQEIEGNFLFERIR